MTEIRKNDIKISIAGHSETAITSPLGGFILSSNLSAPTFIKSISRKSKVDAGAKGCSATAQAIFQNIIFKPLFLQILVLLMAWQDRKKPSFTYRN